MIRVNSESKKPIKIWATGLEVEAEQQAQNLANMPFIANHVALMPDAHFGRGSTVGSVIATKGAIKSTFYKLEDSMQAYHNDPKIKEKYLNRILEHQKADELIKGTYWEDGKGCAVGCTVHSEFHSEYETQLGIPIWLAYIEDKIFEGLPNVRAKIWPAQFLEAITPGQDLNKIKAPFLIFILNSALEKFDHEKYPDCKRVVDSVIYLYESGETNLDKFMSARSDAFYASADASYASAAAGYAAYTASAAANVDAASAAVANAAYAASAAGAAAKNEYVKFADKLLDLIKTMAED